ncbi:MAG: hypothetical protein WC718_12855, partial [Phycisphaerales bacterium]
MSNIFSYDGVDLEGLNGEMGDLGAWYDTLWKGVKSIVGGGGSKSSAPPAATQTIGLDNKGKPVLVMTNNGVTTLVPLQSGSTTPQWVVPAAIGGG